MIKRKKQFSPCDFENTLAIRSLVPHHIVPEDLVFGVFSVLLPKVENIPSNLRPVIKHKPLAVTADNSPQRTQLNG